MSPLRKFADGGTVDPAVAAYFAQFPDGAERMAQAQAIVAQANAMSAPPVSTPPALLSVTGPSVDMGPPASYAAPTGGLSAAPVASAAPTGGLNTVAAASPRESATVAGLTPSPQTPPPPVTTGGTAQATSNPQANREETVRRIFAEQLGRAPEQAALDHYVTKLAQGITPQRIAEEIDRTKEGFDYDTQNITSAYRKAFGRNPDEAGYQFYMGQEDLNLMNTVQIAEKIKNAAKGTDVQALRDNPQGFSQLVVDALTADPFGNRYSVDDPYLFTEDRLRDIRGTPGVSQTAAGQYVQFVSPITQRPMFSGYTNDGQFRVYAGNDVLQPERVRQTVNLAVQSGSLKQADADRILDAISTPEKYREITGNGDPNANRLYALLADPKATVVLDRLGVQIGEDADASLAMEESAARQRVVDRLRETTGQDINPSTLSQAAIAQEMGVKFPFTEANLTIDPLTGKKIRTFMTADDVANNLFTYLKIPTDKTIKNVFTEGLGTYDPRGVAPGGGLPTTPAEVKVTSGDFRGLAFPQARPTEVGETPAMLGFQPYSMTSPGSGQQKTTEPQPIIPVSESTVSPTTGALLGATIGSLLPTPSSGAGFLTGLTTLVDAAGNAIRPTYNESTSVQETPGTYYTTPVTRNIFNSGSGYYKDGGMATPLMKEGGMVPHYADGGASQVALGIDQILSAPSTRGALIGALMSQLLNAQAQSQATNAYRGIDMSKVGVIPPRTTQVGPVRFAPYRQYASRPEIPTSVSSPINIGALRSSQTPMTSFTPTTGMANPFVRTTPTAEMASPLLGGFNPNYQPSAGFDPNKIRAAINKMPSGIMDDDFVSRTPPNDMPVGQRLQGMFSKFGQPMADGGAPYYTYGQSVDPMDYLREQNGMAYGGMAHGGLHGAQHTYDVPTVEGRKDYRAGSAVTGPGDGQSDDIPAMLADGEYVFDADTVAQLGNGSTKAGSKMLDKFREEIRQHKRSAPVNKIPPPSKSPLAYLAEAQKKMKGASRG